MRYLRIFVVIMAITASVAVTQSVAAQTTTPTEIFEVTNANGYRTQMIPDIGTVEYPLAFYSIWSGIPGGTSRDSEIFFPGVITIRPNDSVIYGVQFDTAYQIRIAMSAGQGDLEMSMLGTGPLIQYEASLFEPGDVQRLSLNGVTAFRIDHIPVGAQGEITMHIITVTEGRMIEIVVEPIAEVGGVAIEGLDIVNQIIDSLKLDTFKS